MSEEKPIAETAVAKETPGETGEIKQKVQNMKYVIGGLTLSTIGLLVGVIVLGVQKSNSSSDPAPAEEINDSKVKDYGENPCMGMRPDLPNIQCLQDVPDDPFATGPQSGANVTKGYNGTREVDVVPITKPYREMGLCPVNVHWHIGAEHYSKGEFDENGSGPLDFHEGRQGFQCRYYDENDPKFTTQYNWQHCIGMTVGQSYEVHWPHSTKGACNSPWQYQTPFYDGVFCNLPMEDLLTLKPQDIASNVGVQSQTFVVVNDEDYYYPDLFSGMIVDPDANKGVDLAMYTGSTTGTQRTNEVCSPFSPITWQVDRKCHMISASSFDKMCEQMSTQADNLKDDLYAHGARELVNDMHAANNHQTKKRTLRKRFGPTAARSDMDEKIGY